MTAPSFNSLGFVFDADTLINLEASGQLEQILAVIPCPCYVTRYVFEREVLTGNLQSAVDQKLLEVIAPEELEAETIVRINLDVNSSSRPLGNGEIETVAIALHRGWAVAMDDKRAGNYFSQHYPGVQIITTPDILKFWVDTTDPGRDAIQQTLEQTRITGPYAIRKSHPLYAWWHSWFIVL